MGSATDQLIRQIAGAKTIMSGVQRDAVTDAARAVKPIMESAVGSMTGGDGRLSNNTTKGGKPKGGIKVHYEILGSDIAPYARISATGPIALIEKGAPPHMIAPRKRRGKKASLLGGGYDHPVRKAIRHPGFRGKGGWAKARDTQVPAAARAAFFGRNVQAFEKAFF